MRVLHAAMECAAAEEALVARANVGSYMLAFHFADWIGKINSSFGTFLPGSFSAVLKPNSAATYAFGSIFNALQDALLHRS